MRVRAALLIVPLLFALLAVPVAGSALSPALAPDGAPDRSVAPALQSDGASERSAPALQSDGANQTDVRQVLRINLTDDGDARWSVTTRIRGIDTETDRQSFRDLAAEYEAGETDAGYSTATFEPFAANASEATGREMELVNESRSARLQNGTGYLSISFTWTNFARVDGDRIVLGDVFQTPSGPWLSELEAGQRLVISAPPGYAYESWNFGPSLDGGVQSGTATWTGPATFGPGELEATYVTTESGPMSPTELPLEMIAFAGAGLLAVVGGLALGGYVLRERDDAVAEIVAAIPGAGDDRTLLEAGEDDESPAGRLTPPDDGPTDDAEGNSATVDSDRDAAAAASDDDASAASGSASAATGAASNSGDENDENDENDEIDPELLSDEERVERLLRENGGRMKQANVVKETGWSNAKVSQLLSSMDDEERVNKLRIGRENLISLPDEDVTDIE